MSQRTLWMVRHAELAARGLCYGQLDLAARTLVERADAWRGGPRPSAVFSSPLRRCAETAVALAERLSLPKPSLHAELMELNFGAWEGVAWSDLEPHDAFQQWMHAWQTLAPPGGETVGDLERRVQSFAMRPELPEGAILVTHAGPIRLLRRRALGLSLDEVWKQSVLYLTPECVRLPNTIDT
jgi:alpha-ribazole phosphatase